MVKTGQFTTKFKGDRVVALKRQMINYLEDVARKYHVMAALPNTGVEKNCASFSQELQD